MSNFLKNFLILQLILSISSSEIYRYVKDENSHSSFDFKKKHASKIGKKIDDQKQNFVPKSRTHPAHVLYGDQTPIYLASNKTVTGKSKITYQRLYPVSEVTPNQAKLKRDASLLSNNFNTFLVKEDAFPKPIEDPIRIARSKILPRISLNLGNVESITLTSKEYNDLKANGFFVNHNNKGEPLLTNSEPMPDTVYPELLIMIDYETFKNFNHSINAVAVYMASFWNSVDLNFREMYDPQIRLNIQGLIIPEAADTFSFFNSQNFAESIEEDFKLTIGKSFGPEFQYDMVVGFIWSSVLLSLETENLMGISAIGKACQRGRVHMLLADKGDFSGTYSAHHEMAHSLGSRHDDQEPILKNNPEISIKCKTNPEVSVMKATVDLNAPISSSFHWSECSFAQIRVFIRNFGQCLYNEPSIGQPYPKFLPGQMLTRDQQCEKQFGKSWVQSKKDVFKYYQMSEDLEKDFPSDNDCLNMWCLIKYDNSITLKHSKAPLDGTTCGITKMCLKAECRNSQEVLGLQNQ